jgi:ABC-type sugar transport system permease subunit
MNNHTTYALLVQSQEKGRAIMETAVYITCILSVVVLRRSFRITLWRQYWIRNPEINCCDIL